MSLDETTEVRISRLTREHSALGAVQTADSSIVLAYLRVSLELASALDDLFQEQGCPAVPWQDPVMARVAPAAMERLGLMLWCSCVVGALQTHKRPYSAVISMVGIHAMIPPLEARETVEAKNTRGEA
jgi:hypothetical protein